MINEPSMSVDEVNAIEGILCIMESILKSAGLAFPGGELVKSRAGVNAIRKAMRLVLERDIDVHQVRMKIADLDAQVADLAVKVSTVAAERDAAQIELGQARKRVKDLQSDLELSRSELSTARNAMYQAVGSFNHVADTIALVRQELDAYWRGDATGESKITLSEVINRISMHVNAHPLPNLTPEVQKLVWDWLQSWEKNGSIPDPDLPQERALYHALRNLRSGVIKQP